MEPSIISSPSQQSLRCLIEAKNSGVKVGGCGVDGALGVIGAFEVEEGNEAVDLVLGLEWWGGVSQGR